MKCTSFVTVVFLSCLVVSAGRQTAPQETMAAVETAGKTTDSDAAGNVSTGDGMELYEKQTDHYMSMREAYENE